MRILITGICGFVGSTLALGLRENIPSVKIFGLDNLIRPGSEINRGRLRKLKIDTFHADLRSPSDVEQLPAADWVIDAAANPTVLAGVDNKSSSRQVIEHNLGATVNVIEYCKKHRAGLILLSTSRVYSIAPLHDLQFEEVDYAYRLMAEQPLPGGISVNGITEKFSTEPPLSLYGATKLASETLAAEYAAIFDFPLWINRCGVLAGAGQFGRADQGIFSYWINGWLRKRPLTYVGFGGGGLQVRDCLHPRDLLPLLQKQMQGPENSTRRLINVGGGLTNSMSLAQLSRWCSERFGVREVGKSAETRPFDIPWMVMDCACAQEQIGWSVATPLEEILTGIANHAEDHPEWLELSEA
jgi:CDP-paratose 2-epimerase